MNCLSCYYARARYDRNGVLIGVDCCEDNMRFIDYDIALIQHCGRFSERDDE